jgi:hypothetical protein
MKKKEKTSNLEMWRDTDSKGITAICEYITEQSRFKVSVSFKDKTHFQWFSASFEPRFGMDVIDLQESQKIAEQLAQVIEKEFKI